MISRQTRLWPLFYGQENSVWAKKYYGIENTAYNGQETLWHGRWIWWLCTISCRDLWFHTISMVKFSFNFVVTTIDASMLCLNKNSRKNDDFPAWSGITLPPQHPRETREVPSLFFLRSYLVWLWKNFSLLPSQKLLKVQQTQDSLAFLLVFLLRLWPIYFLDNLGQEFQTE